MHCLGRGDCMIYLYSGTPRSGKSLDVARDILRWIRAGKTVIGTMYINQDMIAGMPGRYIFCDIYEMHPQLFVKFAELHLEKGREGQAKIVIDECYRILGARFQGDANRRDWLEFFPIHGQLGYDVILIAQKDRQIDRQIRDLIEYDILHRKGNNAGNVGWIFSLFFGTFFIRIEKWYGTNDVLSKTVFPYRKKWGRFYDSYMAFDENGRIRKNDLLQYICPPQREESDGGEGAGATGSPATRPQEAYTVTRDGYTVDRYGFIVQPEAEDASSLLDNSNTFHSCNDIPAVKDEL